MKIVMTKKMKTIDNENDSIGWRMTLLLYWSYCVKILLLILL